ncbi:MAG TPA: hypothetical protein VG675_10480 [Bryobacteraceae bacterium]|nr:hypothetical protein [Bryobacteraceae bacterium]
MAITVTARISKPLRAFLCVLIAASFSVRLASAETPAIENQSPVRILDIATPPQAIQANRDSRGFEYFKLRHAGDAAFLLVVNRSAAPDRGAWMARAESPKLILSSPAQSFGGRSPPPEIS